MPKKFFDIIPPEIAKESLPLQKSEVHPKKFPFFAKVLISCFGFLILIGFLGLLFFPKVEIEIWPKTEILTLKEKIKININEKEENFEERVILGESFSNQKSASKEFSSSGKFLKKEKSRGTITVYNAYSTSSRKLVPSRFVSADGKLFWSVEGVTIPGAGEVQVEVVAAEAGEEYNIGPSTFALPALAGSPMYTTIYGKSFSPMTGGFIGETAQVTKEDLEKAENILTDELKKESRNFLTTALPAGFVLLEETISQEVGEIKSSLEAGAEAESFNSQGEVKSEGVGFKKSDLEDFAKYFLRLNIIEDKEIQEQSLEVNYFLESADLEAGEVALNLEIKAKVYSSIDEQGLKKALLGKNLKEARIFLENMPQLTKIEIKSWPFLKRKIPEDMEKVEIKLNLNRVDQ